MATSLLQHRRRRQAGGTMVLFAVSLVVAVGMLALVVDVGRLYITRATLQNQCEAAALAGAMELSGGEGGNDGAQLMGQPTKWDRATYQAKRCAAAMGLTLNDSDISFPTNKTIRVLHNRSQHHTAARALGFFHPKVIGAAGGVGVGAARVLGNGGFPVGIPDEVINGVAPDTIIKIWDTDKITDDAGNVISGGSRGWLNFNFVYNSVDPNGRTVSKSYSNSDLKGWVATGYGQSLYAGTLGGIDGDFVNGDPGVRSSTIQEAASRIGQVVWLPVYDNVYDNNFMDSQSWTDPNIGWASDNYYHVIGFAAFQITDVKHTSSKKYIAGKFVERMIGGSYGAQITGGGGLEGSALME